MDGRGQWFSCGVQARGLHPLPSLLPSYLPPRLLTTLYYSTLPSLPDETMSETQSWALS